MRRLRRYSSMVVSICGISIARALPIVFRCSGKSAISPACGRVLHCDSSGTQAYEGLAYTRPGGMRLASLIRSLIRPYRGTLAIVLMAMLVQTATSVAAPWPLKIVLDNVLGSH